MKVARFRHKTTISFGILDEESDEFVVVNGDPIFGGFDSTAERVPVDDVKLLAPVISRSKIIGVGKNFSDHAAEMGERPSKFPLLFLKPNTSIIGPGDEIVLPRESERVDHEGELAVVIGSVARNVRADDVADVIFGLTIANDVTARDIQRDEGQWTRAKGYDTFCPIGPVIETELASSDLDLETRVNGTVRQSANTGDMVHGIPEIIAFASQVFTLLPGDLILTGTPSGIGPIHNGDSVAIDIRGIGTLVNPVVAR